MTHVSNKPAERARPREPKEERDPGAAGVVPWELGRLFTQLFASDEQGGGARSSLTPRKALGDAAMVEVLTEQLVPRALAASQWPLQAVLYLPRLGRINTTLRREQGAWSIELDAELDATARWLSGVRQQCQDRLARTLGEPVSLHLPDIGST